MLLYNPIKRAVAAPAPLPAAAAPAVTPAPPAPPTPPRTLLEILMPKKDLPADDAAPPKQGEMARILSLPVVDALQVPDLTDELLLPGATAWPGRLKPVQSAALHWAKVQNGLLGPIGVGHGKTLISALLPTVMGSKLAVLLVPAPLLKKTELDLTALRKHWRILPPSQLRVISYNKLSSKGSTGLLEDLRPDLVVADEAHNLRNVKATRGQRFLRFFRLHPETCFCGVSGTMTAKSLYDYWHLAKLALHDGSPLPLNWPEVGVWDVVFGTQSEDERYAAARAGARIALPSDESRRVAGRLVRWAIQNGGGGKVADLQVPDSRDAFRRRLSTAPGVVATTNAECDASLTVHLDRKVTTPAVVTDAIAALEATWQLGDEEISDAMTLAAKRRQLCSGYWLRWKWPNDEPDAEWIGARKAWNRAVRAFLTGRAVTGYDSPALLAAAAERRDTRVQQLWAPWLGWCAVKDRPKPPTVPVWLSEYLVDAAIDKAHDMAPCVLWYEGTEFEAALRKRGLPVFGGGQDSGRLVELALRCDAGQTPPPVICCSIQAHGTGKNLQAWSQALVAQCPSSGTTWEQCIGRHHRQGQKADTVEVRVLQHLEPLRNSWESALQSARYQRDSLGHPQRILFADIVDE